MPDSLHPTADPKADPTADPAGRVGAVASARRCVDGALLHTRMRIMRDIRTHWNLNLASDIHGHSLGCRVVFEDGDPRTLDEENEQTHGLTFPPSDERRLLAALCDVRSNRSGSDDEESLLAIERTPRNGASPHRDARSGQGRDRGTTLAEELTQRLVDELRFNWDAEFNPSDLNVWMSGGVELSRWTHREQLAALVVIPPGGLTAHRDDPLYDELVVALRTWADAGGPGADEPSDGPNAPWSLGKPAVELRELGDGDRDLDLLFAYLAKYTPRLGRLDVMGLWFQEQVGWDSAETFLGSGYGLLPGTGHGSGWMQMDEWSGFPHTDWP